MSDKIDIKLNQWLENLQGKGQNAFSIQNIQEQLPSYTPIAIKSALSRLSFQKKILSIHKGYYLIIAPQYKSKGILPPSLYLDGLMKYLNKPYYLALLNAAAYHGASHQQAQEFFVVTTFPVLRTTQKKGLKVNYISKKELPLQLLESKKTAVGYLQISNPILTATDLIQFEKRVGGMNRVATILSELVEAINPSDFNETLLQYVPITTLQRLGYLLDNVINNQEMANELYNLLKRNKASMFRIALKPSVPAKGFLADKKWNVIVNKEIETDF